MQFNVLSPSGLTVRLKKQDLVLNLSGALNSIASYQFMNLAKTTHVIECGGPSGTLRGQAAIDAGYLDPVTQQPTSTATSLTIFITNSSPSPTLNTYYDGETIKVKWTGGGNLGTPFFGIKSGTTPTVNNTTKTASMVMGNPATAVALGLTWTWSGTPPSGILVYQSRYENDVTIRGITYPGALNGGIFNPHWVDWIRDAGVLRFMDWSLINNSPVVNYSDIPTEAHMIWGQGTDPTNASIKWGTPISLLWKLCVLADCDLWLNFPHQATPTCVDAIFTEVWNNLSATNKKIFLEETNEPWNSGFLQLSYEATESHTYYGTERGADWHGVKSCDRFQRCINIAGTGNRSRLVTVINVQTVNIGNAIDVLNGVDDWLADGAKNTLGYTQRNQIINARALTCYYNGYLKQELPESITKGNPTTVVLFGNSECQVGDEQMFGMIHGGGGQDTGMPEIDGQYGTILTRSYNSGTGRTTITVNINSTGYTDFQYAGGGAWLSDTRYWRLMQKSEDLFNVPGQTTYRDKYHYWCLSLQQLARNNSFTFSDSAGSHTIDDGHAFSLSDHDAPSTGFWVQQHAGAVSDGMSIVMYEAGPTFGCGTVVQGRGSQNTYGAKFDEWSRAYADSPECATVYTEMVARYRAVGGTYPSKYHDLGFHSANNSWGTLRNLPIAGDATDAGMQMPMAKAVKAVMKLKLAL